MTSRTTYVSSMVCISVSAVVLLGWRPSRCGRRNNKGRGRRHTSLQSVSNMQLVRTMLVGLGDRGLRMNFLHYVDELKNMASVHSQASGGSNSGGEAHGSHSHYSTRAAAALSPLSSVCESPPEFDPPDA